MARKIPAEEVKRDNSNLHLYDRSLSNAMKRCRGNKNKYEFPRDLGVFYQLQDMHVDYPYDALDFKLDVESFLHGYTEEQQKMFVLYIHGYTQSEIAEDLCITQGSVSQHLSNMLELFKENYFDSE